jgi:anti-sigma regulatory factor (Ser/Thr protein kinase)
MQAETKPPEAATFQRTYRGSKDQARQVRRDLAPMLDGFPRSDDLILLASELVANAVIHSRSGQPGGTFLVRAQVNPGEHAWVEVEDQGGPWAAKESDDEHGRGLELVAELAGEGNWTIDTGTTPGSHVVWVQLDWPEER